MDPGTLVPSLTSLSVVSFVVGRTHYYLGGGQETWEQGPSNLISKMAVTYGCLSHTQACSGLARGLRRFFPCIDVSFHAVGFKTLAPLPNFSKRQVGPQLRNIRARILADSQSHLLKQLPCLQASYLSSKHDREPAWEATRAHMCEGKLGPTRQGEAR